MCYYVVVGGYAILKKEEKEFEITGHVKKSSLKNVLLIIGIATIAVSALGIVLGIIDEKQLNPTFVATLGGGIAAIGGSINNTNNKGGNSR